MLFKIWNTCYNIIKKINIEYRRLRWIIKWFQKYLLLRVLFNKTIFKSYNYCTQTLNLFNLLEFKKNWEDFVLIKICEEIKEECLENIICVLSENKKYGL